MDKHANFAYSTVRTPPSPAASGLMLDVQAGDAALFPLPSFNAIVCPVNEAPLVGNAEIVRVTSIAADTFHIVRQQEGSNPRTIQAGDQIFAAITAKVLTDIESGVPIGAVQMYGGVTAPSGWLLCTGDSYLRTDYAELYSIIGTTFGAADSNHFNVPNLRDRSPLGANARALGTAGGSLNHQHSVPGLAIPGLAIPSLACSVSDHYHSLDGNGKAMIGFSAQGSPPQFAIGVPGNNGPENISGFNYLQGSFEGFYSGVGSGYYFPTLAGRTGATDRGGPAGATSTGTTGGGTSGGGTSGAADSPYLAVNFIIRAK